MRRHVFVLILCVLLVEACSKGEGPVAAHDPKAGPGPAATSHASNTFTAPISPTSDIAADDTARPRAKEGSMLAGKPYLSLGIEAETIVYDVYVNGAFVSADFDGKPARETRPINHFLRSGKNELTVMIVPWELDDGKRGFLSSHRIELKLLVQQAGALEAPAQTIGSLVFTGAGSGPEATKESTPSGMLDSTRNFERSSAGDVSWGPVQIRAINDDGAMLVSRQFTLPVPFLDWEFLRSDSVPLPYEWNKEQRAEAHDSLLKQYEVIWNALQSREIERIMPLFEERSSETDRAFYHPPGTTQAKLRVAFEEMLSDPTRTLHPLRKKKGIWAYEVGPSGKLMRLTYGPRSNAIIFYEHAKIPDFRTEFPIVFRKKGDKYIVSR